MLSARSCRAAGGRLLSRLASGIHHAMLDEAGLAATGPGRYACVTDSLNALQTLARHPRAQFHIPCWL